MPAPKGNQNAVGNKGGKGGPQKYKPEFVEMAAKACEAGFTDFELAQLFGVNECTINSWKLDHVEFGQALKLGKAIPNERVKRSLYHRATGYTYDSVKIFMPAGAEEPVYAPYTEHVPPDTTAAKYWLSNRCPEEWREQANMTHDIAENSPIAKLVAACSGTAIRPKEE